MHKKKLQLLQNVISFFFSSNNKITQVGFFYKAILFLLSVMKLLVAMIGGHVCIVKVPVHKRSILLDRPFHFRDILDMKISFSETIKLHKYFFLTRWSAPLSVMKLIVASKWVKFALYKFRFVDAQFY